MKQVAMEIEPLKYDHPYESGLTVFGLALTVDELVSRIKTFGWRESFLALADLAAIVANDDAGALSERARILTANGLLSLTASSDETRRLLQRGYEYLKSVTHPLIVAHEEALVFLQHLVLLYGADEENDAPGSAEISIWLLGASDHLDAWFEPESRAVTELEETTASIVNTFRFNRSSQDAVRFLLRTKGIFEMPPKNGPFASPEGWAMLQQNSFGEPFAKFFQSKAVLLYLLSHSWGQNGKLPVLSIDDTRKRLGEGFSLHLASLTSSREELRKAILKRMRPDGVLPHAPTALIRTPLVDVGDGKVVASSPWYVRAATSNGVWARYMEGAKHELGQSKGASEWSIAFGLMLERWCADYARKVETAATCELRIETPSAPGATDEIEDVVAVEASSAILFSVKARFVKEDIARHAISASKLLDWYESYFFAPATDTFRKGVLCQLSSRIDMLRAGEFEPRVPRDARVLPVLVTYDSLCEHALLYKWIAERCRAHNVLQQANVLPVTLARVDDYERLIGAATHGISPSSVLETRAANSARIEVVLSEMKVPPRIPGAMEEYQALSEAIRREMAGFAKTVTE